MARDYGRRRPSRQKSNAPRQLFWILASFLLGYLVATLFDFTSLTNWVNANLLAKHTEKKPEPPARQAELPKPKFEFYTLLAKDRSAAVPIANKPTAVVQAKPTVQPAVIATSPTTHLQQPTAVTAPATKLITPVQANKESYQIQVASFKNKQDAERMKATLILKGFNVTIAAVSQQQISWFRVIVGPFSSRMAAEKTQISLAHNERIKGMIRKMNA